ncbi:hypothetical protein like AT4G29090 [Hibiscus trionum]|uniref:Uncharacterized protein n=1 Tax=Hibiscus trionum TaxID=183268 RepID=A0A9W7J3S9_HIBTR|nr:hypothetical protein like AT4G29090 [Hibiscus trionum]
MFTSIWSVKCPPKVKIFLWKSVWNYLPTLQNLMHKRVVSNTRCIRCNANIENVEHVFRECPFTQQVWHGLGVTWPSNVRTLSYFEWLSWMFNNRGSHSKEQLTYTLWALWKARNQHMHEGKLQTAQSLITYIKCCELEYKECLKPQSCRPDQTVTGWNPPPEGFVKLNVDACCVPATGKVFSGFIIRDEKGDVLGSGIKNQARYVSVFLAEACAARDGLEFAANLGLSSLIVESDSRTLIHKLRATGDDSSAIRTLIADIKNLVRGLPATRFVFTPRAGNKAAHSLAALGKSGTEGYWVEEAPTQAMHAIVEDKESIN